MYCFPFIFSWEEAKIANDAIRTKGYTLARLMSVILGLAIIYREILFNGYRLVLTKQNGKPIKEYIVD
jgi:hypothetical protein